MPAMTLRIFISVLLALVVFSAIGMTAALLATNDEGKTETRTQVGSTVTGPIR